MKASPPAWPRPTAASIEAALALGDTGTRFVREWTLAPADVALFSSLLDPTNRTQVPSYRSELRAWLTGPHYSPEVGEAVAVASTRRLLNGHTRLGVLSECPETTRVQVRVAFGVSPAAAAYFDAGKGIRTRANRINRVGPLSVHVGKREAATLAYLLYLQRGAVHVTAKADERTLHAAAERHAADLVWLESVERRAFLPAPVAAAAIFARPTANDVVDRVIREIPTTHAMGNSVLIRDAIVRRRAINDAGRTMLARGTLVAIRASIEGRELKILRPATDQQDALTLFEWFWERGAVRL